MTVTIFCRKKNGEAVVFDESFNQENGITCKIAHKYCTIVIWPFSKES